MEDVWAARHEYGNDVTWIWAAGDVTEMGRRGPLSRGAERSKRLQLRRRETPAGVGGIRGWGFHLRDGGR